VVIHPLTLLPLDDSVGLFLRVLKWSRINAAPLCYEGHGISDELETRWSPHSARGINLLMTAWTVQFGDTTEPSL
jgi:hypothetical protein